MSFRVGLALVWDSGVGTLRGIGIGKGCWYSNGLSSAHAMPEHRENATDGIDFVNFCCHVDSMFLDPISSIARE